MNESVIEVSHFKKAFGAKVVHRDVSFKVFRGECLGLIGGSGVGKSVILRGMIGLEKPDAGSVVIDGRDVTGMTERQMFAVREKVTYVFQGGALFDSMSVYDNLAYPLREHTRLSEKEIEARIYDELRELGLEGTASLYPASLSGGMQKRVGIARAIILKPAIILYDEPTAGLDPYHTRNLQMMILDLKAKGKTSVLVTHDMRTAIVTCDRIALLHEGVIKSLRTVEDIKNEKDQLIAKFIAGELK